MQPLNQWLSKPPKVTPRYEYNIKKTNKQPHNRYTVRKNSLSLMIYNKEIKNFKKNKRRTQKNKVASSSSCSPLA